MATYWILFADLWNHRDFVPPARDCKAFILCSISKVDLRAFQDFGVVVVLGCDIGNSKVSEGLWLLFSQTKGEEYCNEWWIDWIHGLGRLMVWIPFFGSPKMIPGLLRKGVPNSQTTNFNYWKTDGKDDGSPLGETTVSCVWLDDFNNLLTLVDTIYKP